MRIYATAEAAARAHVGARAASRVSNWYDYCRRLMRRGVIRAATPAEYRRKGWNHGWVLTRGRGSRT